MGIGEKILNRAERQFGKLAFPGILRWIAGFQFLAFILSKAYPKYLEALVFNQGKIFEGEVWRLFSWLFILDGILIFVIITVLFTFFINDVIENEIGTFRLNAYVVGTAFCLILAALSPFSGASFAGIMQGAFFAGMIFAAASFAPNYEILLMFIIPIKLKWIGWMSAAILFAAVVQSPILALHVLFGLLPFFAGIFPGIFTGLKNNATAAARRSKFQRDAGNGENGAFHTCKTCGITDAKDPNMEFRVSSDDGEEYCLPCREKQNQTS